MPINPKRNSMNECHYNFTAMNQVLNEDNIVQLNIHLFEASGCCAQC